jgi:hypothetical protein
LTHVFEDIADADEIERRRRKLASMRLAETDIEAERRAGETNGRRRELHAQTSHPDCFCTPLRNGPGRSDIEEATGLPALAVARGERYPLPTCPVRIDVECVAQ